MTSSKVEKNQGESRLALILRLKLRKIEIYQILALKSGKIEILINFPLLLEENLEGFDPQKLRKVEEIRDSPQFSVSKVEDQFSFHPDLEKSQPLR